MKKRFLLANLFLSLSLFVSCLQFGDKTTKKVDTPTRETTPEKSGKIYYTPITYDIVMSTYEDTTTLVTLTYSDQSGALASSCKVTNLSKLEMVSDCLCTFGVCTVNVRGIKDYYGAAYFTYTVLNNEGYSSNKSQATLSIYGVDDSPVAKNVTGTSFTVSNVSLDGSGSTDLSYSDVEGDLATSCTITTSTGIASSSCLCTAGVCTATYTTTPSFTGVATLKYTVLANNKNSDEAVLSFSVLPSTFDIAPISYNILPPSFNEDTYTKVYLSYKDPNGDMATACYVTPVVPLGITTPCSCSVGVCSVGIINETPDANGYAYFSYNVKANGKLSTPLAYATMTINSVDDPPYASPYVWTTPISEESSGLITIYPSSPPDSYYDVEGDKASACYLSDFVGGTPSASCACTPISGECSFGLSVGSDPAGQVSLNYRVMAGGKLSNKASILVDILGVDDPAIAYSMRENISEDVLSNPIALNYLDPDGAATACYVTPSAELYATACACTPSTTNNHNCFVRIINSTPNYNGLASFNFQVFSSQFGSPPPYSTATGVATISVEPIDDSPYVTGTVSPQSINENKNTIITISRAGLNPGYGDIDGDYARNCRVFNLINLNLIDSCTCPSSSGGSCMFTAKASFVPLTATASFSYQVQTTEMWSTPTAAYLFVTPTQDSINAYTFYASPIVENTFSSPIPILKDINYLLREGSPAATCAVSDMHYVSLATPCFCTPTSGECNLTVYATANAIPSALGVSWFKYGVSTETEPTPGYGYVYMFVTPVDDFPLPNGTVTPSWVYEDAQRTVYLGYDDDEHDLADGCWVTPSAQLSIINSCSCDESGLCSVTLKNSTPDYYGTASISYNVSSNMIWGTPIGTVNVFVSPVNDPPTALAAVTPSVIYEDPTPSPFVLQWVDVDSSPPAQCTASSFINATPTGNCYCTPADGQNSCKINLKFAPEFSGNASFAYTVVDPTSTVRYSDNVRASIQLYNKNDKWVYVTPLPDSGTQQFPIGRINGALACYNHELYLYGGLITSAGGVVVDSTLDDLWTYKPLLNKWQHIKGTPNQSGGAPIFTPTAGSVSPGSIYGQAVSSVSSGFYLFGGYGKDTLGNENFYQNGLWFSNGSTFQFQKGDIPGTPTNFNGKNCGTPTFDSNALPSQRRGSSMVASSDGYLYLFGGYGYTCADGQSTIKHMGDMWVYKRSVNNWSTITYTTTVNHVGNLVALPAANTPSLTNYPSARRDAAMVINPTSNATWIFGGYGYENPGGATGYLNDMWKFEYNSNSPSLSTWAWTGGTPIVKNLVGVFTPTPFSHGYPSSRAGASMWGVQDPVSSDFYLYIMGGLSPGGALRDLWRYNTRTLVWEWISGYPTPDATAIYDPLTSSGTPSVLNLPPTKGNGMQCMDSDPNYLKMWQFGGETAKTPTSRTNDLWELD